VYGLLILAYSQFYTELGVRPSEVGLQYGPGIGGIAGVAVVLLFSSAAVCIVYVAFELARAAVRRPRRARRNPQTRGGNADSKIERLANLWPDHLRDRRAIGGRVITIILAVSLAFGLYMLTVADKRADTVKEGEVIEPWRFWFGVEILTVRADPAAVQLVSRGRTDSQLPPVRLPAGDLFYLGRSDGMVVLYKAGQQGKQRVWHLPASAVSVRASNCETKHSAKDPLCH
jgi:hypothetical protein